MTNRADRRLRRGGKEVTLPQKITDAIDAYGSAVAWVQDDARQDSRVEAKGFARVTRAALERAIADHTSSLVRQIPTAFMGEVPKGYRFVIAVKDASIGRELSTWSRDVASLRADLGTVYQTLARQKGHEAGPEFGSSVEVADHVADAGKMVPPTEAEIGEWRDSLLGYRLATIQTATGFPVYYLPDSVIEQAVALMRRAAAATQAPSASWLRQRLEQRLAGIVHDGSETEFAQRRAFGEVLDWIDEEREREREAGHG